jgi:hypothetical protein
MANCHRQILSSLDMFLPWQKSPRFALLSLARNASASLRLDIAELAGVTHIIVQYDFMALPD